VVRIILLAILILLLARAFWRLVDGVLEVVGGQERARPTGRPVKLVRDPVCGTWISPRDSISLAVRGTTHYFCSDRCRDEFRATA
jgi:YHS domain-containing protein